MSQITRIGFITYSKKLLKEGVKVCPCCLSDKIIFNTDEEHTEYKLVCKLCNIGIHDHLFSRIKKSWNNRRLENIEINKITHNIECTWWDDNKQEEMIIE